MLQVSPNHANVNVNAITPDDGPCFGQGGLASTEGLDEDSEIPAIRALEYCRRSIFLGLDPEAASNRGPRDRAQWKGDGRGPYLAADEPPGIIPVPVMIRFKRNTVGPARRPNKESPRVDGKRP